MQKKNTKSWKQNNEYGEMGAEIRSRRETDHDIFATY